MGLMVAFKEHLRLIEREGYTPLLMECTDGINTIHNISQNATRHYVEYDNGIGFHARYNGVEKVMFIEQSLFLVLFAKECPQTSGMIFNEPIIKPPPPPKEVTKRFRPTKIKG